MKINRNILSKRNEFDENEFLKVDFSLVINYRFVQRIASQMNALKQGFQEILPLDHLKIFDEKEVEVKHNRNFILIPLFIIILLASHQRSRRNQC